MGCPVVLFIPNLIGYVRIALGVAAFGFVDNPLVFCSLYFTSQGLDALDGVCARACGQSEALSVFIRTAGLQGLRCFRGREVDLDRVCRHCVFFVRSFPFRGRPRYGHGPLLH